MVTVAQPPIHNKLSLLAAPRMSIVARLRLLPLRKSPLPLSTAVAVRVDGALRLLLPIVEKRVVGERSAHRQAGAALPVQRIEVKITAAGIIGGDGKDAAVVEFEASLLAQIDRPDVSGDLRGAGCDDDVVVRRRKAVAPIRGDRPVRGAVSQLFVAMVLCSAGVRRGGRSASAAERPDRRREPSPAKQRNR